ncbi:MAG: hypothetical protein GXP63_07605, partial [DPANN group archaeon]|nr:hypothetical protein [DPANN group archaeon]
MTRLVFLGIIFMMALPSALSLAGISADVSAIKNIITKDQLAIFNLTLTNDMPIIDDIEIYSPDNLAWDIYTVPRSDYRVNVFPETTRNVLLYIKPLYVSSGIYDLRLDITSHRTKQKIRANLPVEVKPDSTAVKEYTPFITASINIPEEVDPREPLRFSLTLRNIVPIWMNNVRIRLKGSLIDQSYTTTLGPKEEKEIEFIAHLDPYQSPRKDTVGGEVIYLTENKSYLFEIPKQGYAVKAYADFEVLEEKVSTFYSSRITLKVTNKGNIRKSDDVKSPQVFMDWLFAGTDREWTTKVKDGETVHSWALSLEPNQTITITLTRNYLPVYLTILVIGLLIFFYYLFRSPIILEKSAKKLLTSEEHLRSLKVRIYIKNRTNKVLEEVKIVDRIPQMIEVDKEFHIGTIKPDKILKHTGRATKVIWTIPVLESLEERIITYQLTSKLEIVGGLT